MKTRIFTLLLLFCTTSSFAQAPFWVQTNGPSAGSSEMAFNSKGDIFDYNGYLIHSTDSGATWKDITPAFLPKNQLYAWIVAKDILYIYAGNDSLYRSTDNGNSWKPVYKSVGGYSLGSSPNGALFLMQAGAPGKPSIFLRSLDSGITWKDFSSRVPAITAQYAFFSIIPKGELFLQEDQTPYLYFSTDDGNSWNKQSTLPYRMQTQIQGASNGYLFSIAIYDSVTDISNQFMVRSTDNGKTWDSIYYPMNVVISSNDAIIAGQYDSLSYSEDYGNTWERQFLFNAWLNPGPQLTADFSGNVYWSNQEQTVRYSTIHKDVHELSIPIANVTTILSKNNGKIFAEGLAFLSTSEDRGQSWSNMTLHNGIQFDGNFGSCFDSTGAMLVISGGLYRSTDEGKTWQYYNITPDPNAGPYSSILTLPNGTLIVWNGDKVIYSADLGITWKDLNVPPNQSYSLFCDKSGNLFAYVSKVVFNSTDNGYSWKILLDVSAFLPGSTSQITSLVTTLKDEIYIGTSKDGIIRSTDRGAHWQVVNEGLGSANITFLFAAPNGDVYAFSKSGYLPNGIIYRPYNGTRWYSANSGLKYPNIATTMAFAPDGTAYLGTRGEGVWRSQGAINAVSRPVENNTSLSVTPNPATNRITITYSLNESEYINLGIYDAFGRTLMTFAPSVQNAGEHSANAEIGNLPDGIYFVRLATPYSSAAQKIIISK